jgi:GNAT superfamily N-acetyltransferase
MKLPFRGRSKEVEAPDVDKFLPSRTYGFVRSRELEGTYPGPPNIGTWILTTQRVSKGWGHLPEEFWPYDTSQWPPVEPPGVDEIAKEHRTRSYMRCRTLDDCRSVLNEGRGVLAAFEIDDSWMASSGLIDDPSLHSPQMNHSVVLIGCDDSEDAFLFTHSWGPGWGEGGIGRLPYRYWSERLLEAWLPDEREAAAVDRPDDVEFSVIKREATDCWGNRIHLIEVENPGRDEMMGWAILRESAGGLDMDEFFVRPAFRRSGHGRRMARVVADLRKSLSVPLRAWIPQADAVPSNAQVAILRRLRLRRAPTNERWAAACAVEVKCGPPKNRASQRKRRRHGRH